MQRVADILFEDLLNGELLSHERILELTEKRVQECQVLEYKSGFVPGCKKDLPSQIRKSICGMANSMGGLVIIGIENNTIQLVGCDGIGEANLSSWISTCITPIAPNLYPPPRIIELTIEEKKVIIIVILRSEILVPRSEGGRLVYSIRLYDQTIDAPEYLISDLLLGRRKIPHLRFIDIINSDLRPGGGHINLSYVNISLNIELENDNLLDIETLIFGLITYSKNDRNAIKIGQYIKNFLQINELSGEILDFGLREYYYNQIFVGLKPFEVNNYKIGAEIALPSGRGYNPIDPYQWEFAFYLAPQGISPTWYQGKMEINSELLISIGERKLFRHSKDMGLSIIQLSGERPIIDIRKK